MLFNVRNMMTFTTTWCLWQRDRRNIEKKYFSFRNQFKSRSWIRRKCENATRNDWWKSFASLLEIVVENAISDFIQKLSTRILWNRHVHRSKRRLEFKIRQDCRLKWVENCSWNDQHCTCEFSLYCAFEFWRSQNWKNDALEHWSTRLRESQIIWFDLFKFFALHLSNDEISRISCEKREREYCILILDHWNRFLNEDAWSHAICVYRWAFLNRSSHVKDRTRYMTNSNLLSRFLAFWNAQQSRQHRNVDVVFNECWFVSSRTQLRKWRYRNDAKIVNR